MFGAGQECAAHRPTQASGTVLPYIWLVQWLVKRLSFANSARSSWRFARWYFYLLHSKMWQKKNINCGVDFSMLSFLCWLLLYLTALNYCSQLILRWWKLETVAGILDVFLWLFFFLFCSMEMKLWNGLWSISIN